MPLRITSRPTFGPFTFNISTRGLTSVSMKIGPTRHRVWSATGRPVGLTSVNLPGPFSYRRH